MQLMLIIKTNIDFSMNNNKVAHNSLETDLFTPLPNSIEILYQFYPMLLCFLFYWINLSQ